MTIQHHPDDELLLAYSAGSLRRGPAVLVASHVEGCAACRARVRLFEAMGGVLLDELPPASLAPEALARTLVAIDANDDANDTNDTIAPAHVAKAVAAVAGTRDRPALPPGVGWPHALAGAHIGPWRWLGPGMRWSRVRLPDDAEAKLFLLRIGAGKQLPIHTHSERELTQVLCGQFHDGRALFGRGDFDEADDSFQHQPTVLPDGECICLASVDGRVLFKSAIARTFGSLIGM